MADAADAEHARAQATNDRLLNEGAVFGTSNFVLADMKAKGMKLINETPMIGAGGKKIAFIYPSRANGVLVELYQTA